METYCLVVWRLKSEVSVPARLGSGKAPLPGLQMAPRAESSHSRESQHQLSGVS